MKRSGSVDASTILYDRAYDSILKRDLKPSIIKCDDVFSLHFGHNFVTTVTLLILRIV
jgi:hypothetical protein